MKLNPIVNLLIKTLVPVAIGVGVMAWLIGSEFSLSQFHNIPWTGRTLTAIGLALICVAGRELGMMWRWRVLSDRRISWAGSFKVTLLCEFTSAITPTTAGGSALSMIFLHREGLTLGHATSLTMITLMLDELFFVVACPIIILLVPVHDLFAFNSVNLTAGSRTAFWIVYAGVCCVALLLYAGAFVWPHRIASALSRLFSFRWLKRWQQQAITTGQNLVAAGRDLRTRPMRWWIEAIAATSLSWISRFLVVNALFWGFAAATSQLLAFGRQFIVWTLLTVSPTPGGSGISEWLFTTFYGDLLPSPSMTIVIAILWRILTYYIYFGAVMIPATMLRKTSK